MEPGILAAVAFAYLGMLFVIARYGDLKRQTTGLRSRTTIYPLSLAIYCTTWTFFGSVGLAAASGLSFLAIYIGPILVMTLGFPLLRKVISLSKRQRITSIADFMGARYGKSVRVAAFATVIAVTGTVPYIALQLKAVSASVSNLINPESMGFVAQAPLFQDLSFLIVVCLAVFTILFGTRHADATEHQYGLMLAIAAESAIKLAAFLAVGIFVTFFMFDGFSDLYSQAAANETIRSIAARGIDYGNMFVLILLSLLAFLMLPRQFHVAVVENHSERELSRARWLFPLYLVVINIFVLPIAAAGILTFGDASGADGFVLALPTHAGSTALSLIAFIGGLSAGTAMVIVACVALAIMISNHLVLPLYLRGEGYDIRHDPTDMGQRILNIRRTAITIILLLAFAYYKAADNTQALASIGLVSFAAAAQLAPAFFGGLMWKGANARGAILGMALGFAVWAYTLLIPTLVPQGVLLGVEIVQPASLLHLDLSPLASGVLWSLAFNTAGLVLGSLSRRASPLEEHQATIFTDFRSNEGPDPGQRSAGVTVAQVETTLARYLGKQRTRRALERYWHEAGYRPKFSDPASAGLLRNGEELLASAIGSSSARLVMSLLLQRYEETSSANLQLLDEATEAIQYNYRVLQSAFDQLDQGITVFDSDYKLAFWNQQFRRLLNLPASIGQAGTALAEIASEIAAKHKTGPDDARFNDLYERLLKQQGPWGLALPRIERILEIRSSPMPGGGMVVAWNDITERMMVAEALREANESLEKRVEERTSDLVRANQKLEQATLAADQANQSKTRFLAAAGHDLLQPLNAARLYTSTLVESTRETKSRKLATNVGRSLESVEEILGAVLAISRLDSARHETAPRSFAVQRILDQVAIEFSPVAAEKGLELTIMPCSLHVHSDMSYLRRLLQNLVSNAIKYTAQGKVLVGCRRRGNQVELQVLDTGSGIEEADQQTVFREFTRLEAGARAAPGLGLGLSIVERIAKLLDHPVHLHSQPGRGTRFSVEVPVATPEPAARTGKSRQSAGGTGKLDGLRVLCIDNEPDILDGMEGLLAQWGCKVVTAIDGQTALAEMEKTGFRPQIGLIDYHLENTTGLEAIAALHAAGHGSTVCVLVTADRSSELKASADQAGITILNKPVRPAALRALLSQATHQAVAAE